MSFSFVIDLTSKSKNYFDNPTEFKNDITEFIKQGGNLDSLAIYNIISDYNNSSIKKETTLLRLSIEVFKSTDLFNYLIDNGATNQTIFDFDDKNQHIILNNVFDLYFYENKSPLILDLFSKSITQLYQKVNTIHKAYFIDQNQNKLNAIRYIIKLDNFELLDTILTKDINKKLLLSDFDMDQLINRDSQFLKLFIKHNLKKPIDIKNYKSAIYQFIKDNDIEFLSKYKSSIDWNTLSFDSIKPKTVEMIEFLWTTSFSDSKLLNHVENLFSKSLLSEQFETYLDKYCLDNLKEKPIDFFYNLLKNKQTIWDKLSILEKKGFDTSQYNFLDTAYSEKNTEKFIELLKKGCSISNTEFIDKIVSTRNLTFIKEVNKDKISKEIINKSPTLYYVLSSANTTKVVIDYFLTKNDKKTLLDETSNGSLQYFGASNKRDLATIKKLLPKEINFYNHQSSKGKSIIHDWITNYININNVTYDNKLTISMSNFDCINGAYLDHKNRNILQNILNYCSYHFYDIRKLIEDGLFNKIVNLNVNNQDINGNTVFHQLSQKEFLESRDYSSYTNIILEHFGSLVNPHIKNKLNKTVIDGFIEAKDELLKKTKNKDTDYKIEHLNKCIILIEKFIIENSTIPKLELKKSTKIKI